MSDEREDATGTTGGATGTAAAAAGGSATSPADGSAAVLSAEDLKARLEAAEAALAEERRVKAQLLAEKSNVEQARRELEAQRASAQVPPTAGASADPFATELAALVDAGLRLQSELARDPDNALLRANASLTANAIKQTQREQARWQYEQWVAGARAELAKVPDAIRAQVEQRLASGEYSTVQAAREAVEGKQSATEVEELRKRLAAMEAELKTRRDIGVTTDVATGIAGASSAGAGGREITADEWAKLVSDPAKSDQAMRDYEEGRLRVRLA